MAETLIIIPRRNNWGGVTTFYANLRPCTGGEVAYFEYFSSRDGRGWFNALRFFVRNNLKLLGVLRRESPRLVVVNPSMGTTALMRDGAFLLLAKLMRRKVVVFNHGWNVAFVPKLEKRLLWLYRAVFFRADAYIVLAKEFASTLRRWGYRGDIHQMTTYVGDGIMRQSSGFIRQPVAGFRILFLARVERAKGIMEALSAFELLRRKYPQKNIELCCAGGGPELEQWRTFAMDKNIPVAFTGMLEGEAKDEAFKNADCYILPSHTEGMPISVLEAMSWRLPVAVHLVGGLKDMFDPRMGEATESLAVEDWCAMLERLLNDPAGRVAMGEFNRDYVEKNCRNDIVSQRLYAVFAGVIGKLPPDMTNDHREE